MKFTRTIKSTRYTFGNSQRVDGKIEVLEIGSFVAAPGVGSRTLTKLKFEHGIPKDALLIATEDIFEKRSMDLETFLKYSEVVKDGEDDSEDEDEG